MGPVTANDTRASSGSSPPFEIQAATPSTISESRRTSTSPVDSAGGIDTRSHPVLELVPGSDATGEDAHSPSTKLTRAASGDTAGMGETEATRDAMDRRDDVHVSLLRDLGDSSSSRSTCCSDSKAWGKARRVAALRTQGAFFSLGLINNASYVIMMALAKDILPAAVGYVFLADVFPTLLVKLSAPYWFHLVPYNVRITASSVMLIVCFTTVAYGNATWVQLIGVACSAIAGGLGEPSCLALASLYDTPRALSAWSSGSGAAGIFSYGWVFILKFVFGLSNRATLMMACILAMAWMFAYFALLVEPHADEPPHYRAVEDPSGDGGRSYHMGPYTTLTKYSDGDGSRGVFMASVGSPSTSSISRSDLDRSSGLGSSVEAGLRVDNEYYSALPSTLSSPPIAGSLRHATQSSSLTNGDLYTQLEGAGSGQNLSSLNLDPSSEDGNGADKPRAGVTVTMTATERLCFVLSLWRFMVPLTLVFFAEYTMQTGTWSAIGFPVTSAEARKRFYEYSNLAYWAGVFVSRSSGIILKISAKALWILPVVQLFMVFFFLYVAAEHFWYGNGLLVLCFGVGLIGGLAYVNAFRLVAEAVPLEQKELALASASVGDSMGIVCATIAGKFVQKCLYRMNGISD